MTQIADLKLKIDELEAKNESAEKEKALIEQERDEVKEHARELVDKVKFETEGNHRCRIVTVRSACKKNMLWICWILSKDCWILSVCFSE